MERINNSLINANIKLVDENKELKEEINDCYRVIEQLNNIIHKAINILELSAMNKGMCTKPEIDTIQSVLLVLKGEDKE